MKHKFAIEYEGMNGKREFANTDELLVNGDNIEHMIVVPKGATNGDMIKAMFPKLESREKAFEIELNVNKNKIGNVSVEMWNDAYVKEVEE